MADREKKPTRDPIAAIDEKIERLKRTRAELHNQRRGKAAKRHTRCLILIGGALAALAEEDTEVEALYKRVFARAGARRENDAHDLAQWRVERADQRKRAAARAASTQRAGFGAGASAPAAEADNPGGARDAREVSSPPGASHPHPNPPLSGAGHNDGGDG